MTVDIQTTVHLMNVAVFFSVLLLLLFIFSGAVPTDTDWLDLARPIIEKRIQKFVVVCWPFLFTQFVNIYFMNSCNL